MEAKMTHKILPSNVVEPDLLDEWHRLNMEVFNNEIQLEPTTLCWHYDIRKTGGYCAYENNDGYVKIVIKATLKENPDAWRLTLAHEMIHQLLWERYNMPSELGAEVRKLYTTNQFLGDQGYFFKAEAYRIVRILGIPLKHLLHWRYDDEDTNLKDQSQRAYLKSKENAKRGKAMKGKLFPNG